jgi:outer membrane immunogenic protein
MVYDWTGMYVGGHLGYGWGDSDFSNSFFWPNQWDTLEPDGFLGGLQLGYWWQTDGGFVFGLDGSWSWTNMDDSSSITFGGLGLPVTFTVKSEIESIALLQARLGWANGRWLIFGQGGYAGVDANASVSATILGGPSVSLSDDNWHNGWTIGAGTAYKFSQNFSIGAEYNYIDTGSESYNWTVGLGTAIVNVEHDIHVVKVTGNYHF